MLSLLVIGGILFWGLTILGLCFVTWFVESESPFAASMVMIAWLVYFLSVPPHHVLPYLVVHPWMALLYLLAYIAVGVSWSVIKWVFILSDCSEYARQKAKEIQTGNYYKEYKEDEKKEEVERAIRDSMSDADHQKSSLGTHATFWPVSVGWFLLHEPIGRLIRSLSRVYNAARNHFTKSLQKEFGVEVQK